MSHNFQQGLKRGIPVAIGYLPIAVTFGVVATSAGIPAGATIAMSVFVFAGASQFVAVNLVAGGAGVLGIIITTFFVNMRHILMSATVSEKLKQLSKKWLAILAFGVTDESFSIISTDSRDSLAKDYVLGLIIISYMAWTLGTAGGVLIGENLPPLLESSMEIALYAMFIGLIVPELKISKEKLMVALIAILLGTLQYWLPYINISEGWRITLSTAGAALCGAYFFKGEEKDE